MVEGRIKSNKWEYNKNKYNIDIIISIKYNRIFE